MFSGDLALKMWWKKLTIRIKKWCYNKTILSEDEKPLITWNILWLIWEQGCIESIQPSLRPEFWPDHKQCHYVTKTFAKNYTITFTISWVWVSHYPLVSEELKPLGILNNTSVANCCPNFFTRIKIQLQSWSFEGVVCLPSSYPKWEKIFTHPQPITTCSFPHTGWVHELLGWRLWCWLCCLRPFPPCSLKNEETFVFVFIVLAAESHTLGQIRWGMYLGEQSSFCQIQLFLSGMEHHSCSSRTLQSRTPSGVQY